MEVGTKFVESHRAVLYILDIQRLRSAALEDSIVEVVANSDAEFAMTGAGVEGAAIGKGGYPLRRAGPCRPLERDDPG